MVEINVEGIDCWILSAEQWMVHWNELVAMLKAAFGNVFHLPYNDICIGACNVAARATNTFPANATASCQIFTSDFGLVLSRDSPTQDGLIWMALW